MVARIASAQMDLLPCDIEAESAILGSIIIDPDAMIHAQQQDLRPADFLRERNGMVYRAMQDLAARYQPIDLVTLSGALAARHPQMDDWPVLLSGYIDAPATCVHAPAYAEIVKRKARQRRMIAAAAEITAMASAHDGPIDALYSRASARWSEALEVTGVASHLYGGDAVLENYLVNQEARAERLATDPNATLHTGLGAIDDILGDIIEESLFVIAAQSSVGKTLLMEQIAEYNALRGHRVAYYHLELSSQFMLDRAMARYSHVPVSELRKGERGANVGRAMDAMRSWIGNVVYVHCAGWTADRIATDIRRLWARGECEIAIVDYLQKVRPPDGFRGNRTNALSEMTEALKIVAEDCLMPIVLGSQVSRTFKGNEEGRSTSDDIRDSGEVKEKANQLIVINRLRARKGKLPVGTLEPLVCSIEKNTSGGCGECIVNHEVGYNALIDAEEER